MTENKKALKKKPHQLKRNTVNAYANCISYCYCGCTSLGGGRPQEYANEQLRSYNIQYSV